ncbi:MAG: peptide deformylase [Proteobacteria bacterium]|nr:peptide deformylase [Pseudomonadota bacterium]
MAIRKIARMGHPVLRQKARELKKEEILAPAFKTFLNDMFETMVDYDGVGLAAPQVYESIAVAIVQYPMDAEPVVVINPKITVLDDKKQGFWEGCLSVPEIRGLVYRPRKIKVDYLDLHAKPQSVTVEGFGATVFQHELDHLDGVLFIDRIEYKPGASPISFVEEYSRYHAPKEDDDVGELDD